MAKFLWERPPYPRLNSRARYFVWTWGLHIAVSHKNFSAPWPPRGRYEGSKIFLPPQNSLIRPPQNYVIMLAFVSPTNSENLVKGCQPVFFHRPIWKYVTPVMYEQYMWISYKRSQLLILLAQVWSAITATADLVWTYCIVLTLLIICVTRCHVLCWRCVHMSLHHSLPDFLTCRCRPVSSLPAINQCRCYHCWSKRDSTAHRWRITDQFPIWHPSPRSSRDLCWFICDHTCSVLSTSANFSLLIGRDIPRRAHCWRFWMMYTQLVATKI